MLHVVINVLSEEEKASIISLIENNTMEISGDSVESIGMILVDENFSGVCLSGESKSISSWQLEMYSSGYGWEDLENEIFSCHSPLDATNEKLIENRPPSIIYREGNEEFFGMIDQLVEMMLL